MLKNNPSPTGTRTQLVTFSLGQKGCDYFGRYDYLGCDYYEWEQYVYIKIIKVVIIISSIKINFFLRTRVSN